MNVNTSLLIFKTIQHVKSYHTVVHCFTRGVATVLCLGKAESVTWYVHVGNAISKNENKTLFLKTIWRPIFSPFINVFIQFDIIVSPSDVRMSGFLKWNYMNLTKPQ